MRRRSTMLTATVGAALLVLTACGSGGDPASDDGEKRDFQDSESAIAKDPDRQGPAPEIEDARPAARSRSTSPGTPGPDSLDPAEGWSVTGNSIQQALTNRSLTQFARDPETGKMLLVPDLAVDLGTPNKDFTEWTFQLRDDATWETGDPVTAEEVAFGITRTLDAERSRRPRHRSTPRPTSRCGTEYKRPVLRARQEYDGVTFDADANTVTIKMSTPFPDMDYWGSFMAMGPAPLGDTSNPPDYGKDPLATGPYMVDSSAPVTSSSWSRTTSGTRLRPGPAPVRRRLRVQVQPGPGAGRRDHAERQHRVADRRCPPPRLGQLHQGRLRAWATALCSSPRSASPRSRPTTTRSPTSRSARRSPTPTPTRATGSRSGRCPV